MPEISSAFVSSILSPRQVDSHKGMNGRVLLYCGSDRYPGAAKLACLGALRGGAGLVTLSSDPGVCQTVASQIPEVTYLAKTELAGYRVDSVCIGPGNPDVDPATIITRTLANSICLDAGALSLPSQFVKESGKTIVLTPHEGEAAGMLGWTAEHVRADRFGALEKLVDQYGAIVLLKGASTLVSSPSGEIWVNPTGHSGMATGGMGDVLAGLITCFLAQMDGLSAAIAAVYLHGLAGEICAQEIGEIGYTASELANALPRARDRICRK